jgi:hypothetical protein
MAPGLIVTGDRQHDHEPCALRIVARHPILRIEPAAEAPAPAEVAADTLAQAPAETQAEPPAEVPAETAAEPPAEAPAE